MFKTKVINFWRLSRQNKLQTRKIPVLRARQTAQEIKRLALKKLFHQSEFSKLDGLNEYDEDYTKFTPLGDLITQEMQARLDQRLVQTTEAEPANSHPHDSDKA